MLEDFKMLQFAVAVAVMWFVFKIVKFRKDYPQQNFTMAILDTVLTPVRMLGLGPYSDGKLTIAKAMKAAEAATGLSDWGDTEFIENYKFVTETPFYKKLRHTNIGYLMTKKERLIGFTKKLRINDFLKKAPQVKQVPMKSPIIVFGLGRSGTTFVHRLISLDPNIRAPKLWEELVPCPDVGPDSTPEEFAKDREKRIQFVRDKIKEREKMGQNAMEEFHEINADLPEEDMMGLAGDLPCGFQELYSFLCAPGGFADVLKGERVRKAYENYKHILQMLAFQTGEVKNEKQWAIKFPVHILYIDEIAKVFPDAKLVWAHRHPVPTVSSLSAMMSTVHDIYYDLDTQDRREIGRNIKGLAGRALTKATADLKKTKLECANVIFNDLVEDPIAVVRNIYKQFKMEYTQDFEDTMKAYMVKNNAERLVLKQKVEAQGKEFDVHYPETYGLTVGELTEGPFADYLKEYPFPAGSVFC